MSDRHAGYIVTLESDQHEDHSKETLRAIQMIKGVISVEPIVSGFDIHIAQERARLDMFKKFREICFPTKGER